MLLQQAREHQVLDMDHHYDVGVSSDRLLLLLVEGCDWVVPGKLLQHVRTYLSIPQRGGYVCLVGRGTARRAS